MKDSLFLVARTDTKLSTESIVDAGRKTDKERKRERERERLSRREHAREQIRSPTRASINSRFRQVRDAMVDH